MIKKRFESDLGNITQKAKKDKMANIGQIWPKILAPIDVQENYFYVTFKPNPEYLKLASEDKKSSVKTVGKTVGKILTLINENPKITREELSAKTGLSIRGVEWNLAKLKQKGLLKRVGSAKGGHWEIAGKRKNIKAGIT